MARDSSQGAISSPSVATAARIGPSFIPAAARRPATSARLTADITAPGIWRLTASAPDSPLRSASAADASSTTLPTPILPRGFAATIRKKLVNEAHAFRNILCYQRLSPSDGGIPTHQPEFAIFHQHQYAGIISKPKLLAKRSWNDDPAVRADLCPRHGLRMPPSALGPICRFGGPWPLQHVANVLVANTEMPRDVCPLVSGPSQGSDFGRLRRQPRTHPIHFGRRF